MTDSTFDKEVMQSESGIWFVRFFAPWCGHCKRMASSWEIMSSQVKGTIPVADVDATTETQLAAKYHIEYYPTILLFTRNTIYEYDGPRNAAHLVQFAKEAKESIESGGTPKDCSVYMKRNGKGEFVYQKPPENSYAIHTWMRLGGIAILFFLWCKVHIIVNDERPLLNVV
ncbi:hypothetical protein WA538_005026 [Blastocystis sp. DL]